jgi:CHRD domain
MMKLGGVRHAALGGVVIAALATGSIAVASDNGSDEGQSTWNVMLTGYQEDPLALSTTGTGTLRVQIDDNAQELSYELTFGNLEAPALQSHIHFGGRAQSGGISVFLCTNLGNGPAGTQLCPASPATITGTIVPANVLGPTGQGIPAGGFAELVEAMKAGVTYANVHSSMAPGGEIRAQLRDNEGNDD